MSVSFVFRETLAFRSIKKSLTGSQTKINKFNKSGKFISSWGAWGINAGEFYKPKGLSIDDKDRLIVMDFGNHRGQIFDSDGTFIEMFGISEKPLEVNRGEK